MKDNSNCIFRFISEGTLPNEASSTGSSQYSYSYQDKEFIEHRNAPLIVRRAFEDLEAQKLVKYVSKSDDLAVDQVQIYLSLQ